MNFSRSQLVIIGSVIFVVLLIAGIFTGILPGTREPLKKQPEISLTIWGTDNQEFFQDNLRGYEVLRPNARIDYEKINPETYERDLVNALAAGTGPDIVMFKNSWLPKHFNKLIPIKENQLNLKSLREVYPTVIEQDFAPTGKIYALPLYIDTLALFYNQDTFDKNGIAVPPKDWLDFQNLVPKLRQKDPAGKITKPAAAIGGSNQTIANASDLLMLLMIQAGAKMTDNEFRQATFAQNLGQTNPGAEALDFYSKFSDPKNTYYTWGENLEYSLDSFARGNTAMIFNYGSEIAALRNRNPFLNFKIAPMPQPAGGEKDVNYPNYWGLAVTNNSKNPDWAWDAILYFTQNESAAENYLKASNRAPALRSLIQKYADHPELGVLAKQALSTRSWPQIDDQEIRKIFSNMISATISGQLELRDALAQAERQVTELMQTRR